MLVKCFQRRSWCRPFVFCLLSLKKKKAKRAGLCVRVCVRLSFGTLGCCESAHKLFIRLNLGTLLPLASELVNWVWAEGGSAAGRGSAHQECHLVAGPVHRVYMDLHFSDTCTWGNDESLFFLNRNTKLSWFQTSSPSSYWTVCNLLAPSMRHIKDRTSEAADVDAASPDLVLGDGRWCSGGRDRVFPSAWVEGGGNPQLWMPRIFSSVGEHLCCSKPSSHLHVDTHTTSASAAAASRCIAAWGQRSPVYFTNMTYNPANSLFP